MAPPKTPLTAPSAASPATVRDCALLDQVLAAEVEAVSAPAQLRGLRFAVPKTVFQNDLSSAVADAFTAALGRLSSAGAAIVDLPVAEFAHAAGATRPLSTCSTAAPCRFPAMCPAPHQLA